MTIVGTHRTPETRDEMLASGSRITFNQDIPRFDEDFNWNYLSSRTVSVYVGDTPMQMPVVDISRDGLRLRTEESSDVRLAWGLFDLSPSNLARYGRTLVVGFHRGMIRPTEDATITVIANRKFDELEWTQPFPSNADEFSFTFPADMDTYKPDTLTNVSLLFEGLSRGEPSQFNLWIEDIHLVPEPAAIQLSAWLVVALLTGRRRWS